MLKGNTGIFVVCVFVWRAGGHDLYKTFLPLFFGLLP